MVAVGTTVHDGVVSVRIYATGGRAEAEGEMQRVGAVVKERLGDLVFGDDEMTIEGATAEVLKARRYTLATAESCTGGLLATMLTDVPGSSAYFLRGWVTYANVAKHDDLAVPTELIEKHGAVSEEVARAMAEGARKWAASDFALSTTGIAGPDGGTAEKPVGTVWIGLAFDGGSVARKFVMPGDRVGVRRRTAQMALAMLRWRVMGAKGIW